MKQITIRNITIGEGIPKICVPIVGKSEMEIRQQAENVKLVPMDIVEWRLDFYEDVMDFNSVRTTLKGLRDILPDVPLLGTLRTKKEGGEISLSFHDYETILLNIAKSGLLDLIDVEAFSFGEIIEMLIRQLHMCGMIVIGSSHDFKRTSTSSELYIRLKKIRKMDADILKLAVMPVNSKDVLALLSATMQYAEKEADCPLITMAMGGLGAVTRTAGEIFHSAVTFASAGNASAPGQLEAFDIKKILELFHEKLQS